MNKSFHIISHEAFVLEGAFLGLADIGCRRATISNPHKFNPERRHHHKNLNHNPIVLNFREHIKYLPLGGSGATWCDGYVNGSGLGRGVHRVVFRLLAGRCPALGRLDGCRCSLACCPVGGLAHNWSGPAVGVCGFLCLPRLAAFHRGSPVLSGRGLLGGRFLAPGFRGLSGRGCLRGLFAPTLG